MYKRREPRRVEASLLLSFGSAHSYSSRACYPLFFLIKLSCNTDLFVASNFCCGETEPRKLHNPPTYMVPFLGSNLAEITSAWSPRGRGQAQQKPNSAKAPVVEAEHKKTQHSGSDNKPTMLETETAKTDSAESSHDSVSDSRRPQVHVGDPRCYGWKDIWLTKA